MKAGCVGAGRLQRPAPSIYQTWGASVQHKQRPGAKVWSEHEEYVLRQKWVMFRLVGKTSGQAAKLIAEELGRTPKSVVDKASQMKLHIYGKG